MPSDWPRSSTPPWRPGHRPAADGRPGAVARRRRAARSGRRRAVPLVRGAPRRRGHAHHRRLPATRAGQRDHAAIRLGRRLVRCRQPGRPDRPGARPASPRPGSWDWSASNRGKLVPTAAARRLTENLAGLFEHIARRLPLGASEAEQQAGVLWLLAVAAGRSDALQVVGRGLAALGWVDRVPATRRSHGRDPPRAPDADGVRTAGADGRRRVRDRRSDATALARATLLAMSRRTPRLAGQDRRPRAHRHADRGEPPVWRRVVVPESLALRELHGVLQSGDGWRSAHLHLFRIGQLLYGDVEDFTGELGDEDVTTVGDVAAQIGEFDYTTTSVTAGSTGSRSASGRRRRPHRTAWTAPAPARRRTAAVRAAMSGCRGPR